MAEFAGVTDVHDPKEVNSFFPSRLYQELHRVNYKTAQYTLKLVTI